MFSEKELLIIRVNDNNNFIVKNSIKFIFFQSSDFKSFWIRYSILGSLIYDTSKKTKTSSKTTRLPETLILK